jgi:hypothetical protein
MMNDKDRDVVWDEGSLSNTQTQAYKHTHTNTNTNTKHTHKDIHPILKQTHKHYFEPQ